MGQTGTMVTPKYGAKAFGWEHLCDIDVTWLLEAYVAVTDDGKIDTTQTSLTSSSLDNGNIAFVGGLLYTQGLPANCIIQTAATTSKRSYGPSAGQSTVYTGPNSVAYRFSFPRTSASDNADAPFMNLSQGNIHYYDDITNTIRTAYFIGDKTANGLPSSISGSFSYKTQVDGVINDPQFCIDVVRDLQGTMGETQILAKLNDILPNNIKKQVTTSSDTARLFPDSDDPLVQWAVVATPLAVNTANCGYDIGFWITRDRTPETGYLSLDVITTQNYGTISFAMDAYTQAWYNGLTRNMFNLEGYREYLNEKYKIPLSYLENGTGGINSGQPIQGSYTENWGLLRKEYSTNFNKLADIAYIDSTRWPDHCLGIYSPKDDWHSSASTYARYGGITIAFSKEPKDNTVPVYYYITPDPNDPTQTDPKSVPVDKP